MYKPENPAPMMISNRAVPGTGLVLRRGEIATDLLNGTGQMQTRDPPFTVLLDVGFVVVTGAVQFAAVGKDDPVLHRPDPGCGGGRSKGEFRSVAMMHGGRALQ